ncbi:MAG: DMT family transporter [Leptospiraceae bacterium]|nr:DMT family transporter [Leptospiraceae bacterium]
MNWLGILFIAISAIGFSSKAILVKLSYRDLSDPITILFLRMLFAFPFFLFMVLKERHKFKKLKLNTKDLWHIFTLGFIGYYLSSLFDFMGLKYITASLERLILYIYPTIVFIIHFLLFKKEIHKNELISLFLTYGGVAFVFMNNSNSKHENKLLGGIYIFLCALTYAWYISGSEKYITKMGSTFFASNILCISSLIVFLHFFVTKDTKVLFALPLNVWLTGLGMGIFSTVIPVYLVAAGIRMIGSKKAAIAGTIGPVSTILLSYYILDEPISSMELIGSVFIISGVLLIGKK